MINMSNRQEILGLIEKAQKSLQIANSWLTDEFIITKLLARAKELKIEILLSRDPLNIFRYESLRKLQAAGVNVRKSGSEFPGQPGFMHAKYMIVDGTEAHGGSYNLTEAASLNFENFSQYTAGSLAKLRQGFEDQFRTSVDYSEGFDNPEIIRTMILKKAEAENEFRSKFIDRLGRQYESMVKNDISERSMLIQDEVKREELKQNALKMQEGSLGISTNGQMDENASIKSKPHKFYGGNLKSRFAGAKEPNSFALAWLQKRELETKFSFLKCRIKDDTLIATGDFQPDGCNSYRVRIEFRAGAFPMVYVLNPNIKANAEIHMYKEGNLCLFYPGDQRWKNHTSIADYTIPWIFEWLLYYELYLLSGVWEGESVPHGNNLQLPQVQQRRAA